MIGKRFHSIVLSGFAALLVVYFIFHMVQGERGWFAMLRHREALEEAKLTLQQLQGDHDALAHKIDLMKDGEVDPDLLDEQARRSLNYAKPNDIIILTPQRDSEKSGGSQKP